MPRDHNHLQQERRDYAGGGIRLTSASLRARKFTRPAFSHESSLSLAVNRAAERFFHSNGWESVIEEVLTALVKASGADRVYLFENECKDGHKTFALRYESTHPQASSLPSANGAAAGRLVLEDLPRWDAAFSNNRIICGNIQDFPESEQAVLSAQGMESVLFVPVMVGQHWWGILGLTKTKGTRNWRQDEANALKIIAGMLGATIQRRQTETLIKELYNAEREQRLFAQAMQSMGERMSATLQVQEILDLMVEDVDQMISYDTAALFMVDGDEAWAVRIMGYEQYAPEAAKTVLNVRFEIDEIENLGEMRRTGRPVIVPDTLNAPGWVWRDLSHHIRSHAGAPIQANGKLIGFISLDKIETGFYQPIHGELLAAYCSQAGLALQNAMLFAETTQLLEREQGLNELIRIISTIFDLPKAIHETLHLTARLVNADGAALAIVSATGDELYYTYQHNLPKNLVEIPIPRQNGGTAWESIESGRPLLVQNYKEYPQANQEWVEAGLQSLISVPVICGETVMGVIGLFGMNTGTTFKARDLAFVESIGRQMGIAIQNVRLFEAIRRRAHEAETLRQASSAVTSSLDLANVLDRIMVHVEKVVPYDSAAVFLLENNQLHMVARRGLPMLKNQAQFYYPADDPLFQETVRTGQAVTLLDASLDERYMGWGESNHVHGWIGAPLLAQGKTIGILTLDSLQVAAYDSSDALLVQAFANEAAIAIDKARLFDQVQDLAIRDPLTGLYNRRYFFEVANKEIERGQQSGMVMSMIIMDIDYFKLFNDRYGHMTGDQVLVSMAKICQENVREGDVIARYGGEEFLVLLPNTSISMAVVVAERIRLALAGIGIDVSAQSEAALDAEETTPQKVGISVSFGVADNRAGCTQIEKLFERADQALYYTKRTGRGRISVWNEETPIHSQN